MAKILLIPDVHGSHQWEVVKTIPRDAYDFIVFMGDYFDSWQNEWPDQGDNFQAICSFIREDPEKRVLLIGNHDWAYLTGTSTGKGISGHQSAQALKIKYLLKQNLDIIDLAFECDGWVFSHAGFSKTWVNSIKKVFHQMLDKWPDAENNNPSEVWNEDEFNVHFLNTQWHKYNHSNEDNVRYDFDELLDWHGFFSGSGDEISQGPLWIRPESLLKDAYYPKQVIGHTEMCLYEKIFLQKNENKAVVVDSTTHEVFDVFDTERDYSYMTIPEYFKWYKVNLKIINDIKSQIIYHKDEKSFIKDSLLKHFPQDVADIIYRIGFENE